MSSDREVVMMIIAMMMITATMLRVFSMMTVVAAVTVMVAAPTIPLQQTCAADALPLHRLAHLLFDAV